MPSKHILIVGGTRGSGRVLVRRFAGNHDQISLLGRHPSPEVRQQLPGVHFFPVDLQDSNSISDVIDRVVKETGKITHLIFFQRFRGTDDDWQGELQISLTATRQIIEQSVDFFDPSQKNSIVIVSSMAAHFVHNEQPVSYHVAKAGLNQMVCYYAVTLGPRSIRVNCVSPSMVIKEESQQYYEENKDLRRLYEEIIPLRRMGTAEDIADAIEFLCSDKASYITGQEIVVDGGLSLRGQSSLARSL